MDDLRCYQCSRELTLADQFCPRCKEPAVLMSRYWVRGTIGQGGFGKVYEGRDLRVGQRCAIKRLDRQVGNTDRIHEVMLMAANADAGIAFVPKIFDYLDDPSGYYIMMEYILGNTLDQLTTPWPPRRVEEFVWTLLGYLARLHDLNIIHRDIKPANIKRTPDDRYVLLDFGIARRITESSIGGHTPDYAPIEQLRREGSDGRADLFSLGVTAYQLLTSQLPPNVIARQSGQEVPPPSALIANVPPPLEQTIMHLLALEPRDRPATAQAARAELRPLATTQPEPQLPLPITEGETLERDSSTYRPQLDRQGKGRIVGLVAAPRGDLLALATSLGTYLYDAETLSERRFMETTGAAQRLGFVQGGDALAMAWHGMARMLKLGPRPSLRTLTSFPSTAQQVAFAPDGQRVAAIGSDGVQLWRIDGSQPPTLLDDRLTEANDLAFSPGGTLLGATGGRRVWLWDTTTCQLLRTSGEYTARLTQLVFAPGDQLFATVAGKSVVVWRVSDGRHMQVLPEHPSRITGIAFTPDGHLLAVAGGTQVALWQVQQGSLVRRIDGRSGTIVAVGAVRSGQALAVATSDSVSVWNLSDGKLLSGLAGHLDSLAAVAYAPDQQWVASMGRTVQLWRRAGGKLYLERTFAGHTDQHNSLAFSPDSRLLAAASSAGITVWQVSDGTVVQQLDYAPVQSKGIVFTADGSGLVVVADTIVTVQLADGSGERIESAQDSDVYEVALSADGRLWASVADDSVQVHRVTDGHLLGAVAEATLSLRGGETEVQSVALTADGTRLAIATSERVVAWSVGSAAGLEEIPGSAQHLAFAPDGRTLALITDNKIAILRQERDRWQQAHVLSDHSGYVSMVAFAPDGKTLVSSSHDGTVRLWQL